MFPHWEIDQNTKARDFLALSERLVNPSTSVLNACFLFWLPLIEFSNIISYFFFLLKTTYANNISGRPLLIKKLQIIPNSKIVCGDYLRWYLSYNSMFNKIINVVDLVSSTQIRFVFWTDKFYLDLNLSHCKTTSINIEWHYVAYCSVEEHPHPWKFDNEYRDHCFTLSLLQDEILQSLHCTYNLALINLFVFLTK